MPEKANLTSPSPSDVGPGSRAQRILIVDDERDTVLGLMTVLRMEGYDVRAAYSGRSALKEIEEFNPDTVIVDIAMPGMSGWDLAREVRNRHQHRPKLIAISGTYVKVPDQLLSRVAGFNYFLLKPCHPDFLMKILGPAILSGRGI